MNYNLLSAEELKKEKSRLKSLYQYHILDTNPEELYDSIVDIACYICGTPISLISLIDSERQWFKAKKGLNISQTNRDVSFCDHAIRDFNLMEVKNAREDERFKNNSLVTSDPHISYYAGSPLITPDGNIIGTLCVIDTKPNELNENQKKHLNTLATQVIFLLEFNKQKKELLSLNNKLIRELQTKVEDQNKVLTIFSKFVPKQIVAKHLAAKNSNFSDAELKEVTILFCDIRDFTKMVENLHPSQAVNILQCYYTVMSDIISAYGGSINQYVGDEIFAVFVEPFSVKPYELNAVFCSIEMMSGLKVINEKCREFTEMEIKVGIGVHKGDVIMGTFGSSDKIEFSITGDTVNTGKRIESLTKVKPNTVLVSEKIYDCVHHLLKFEKWQPMEVKGKLHPIDVYELLYLQTDHEALESNFNNL